MIVRDMWLNGFDAPCLHTLYIDKQMTGHNLMQAIARVNRVFKNKEGGLIVDYIGIAQDLKKALTDYTSSGGKGEIKLDQAAAVAKILELHSVVMEMFHPFDYKQFFGLAPREKFIFLLDATDFILGLDNGKERFTEQVSNLSKAFGLAVPHPEALAIAMTSACSRRSRRAFPNCASRARNIQTQKWIRRSGRSYPTS